MLPRIDWTTVKPGAHIDVLVDDVLRETYVDEDGVQRFVKNSMTTYKGVSVTARPGSGIGEMDWNQLCLDYAQGLVSDWDNKVYHMDSGYSVCGFLECCPKTRLDNPLWEDVENGYETEDLIAELKNWRKDLTDVPLLDRAIAKLEEQLELLEG